jgi:hypothetical protein
MVFSNGKNNTKSILNTGQYVPVSKTMKAFLLDNHNFFELRKKHGNYTKNMVSTKNSKTVADLKPIP